jgi:putative flippase GtrA
VAYRWSDHGSLPLSDEAFEALVATLPATPAALVGELPGAPAEERGGWLARALSFGRFVLVGSASTAVSSVLFLLFGWWMSAALANTAAIVLTTVVANQAHARWTFDSERRGLGMHLRAGLSVAITYPVTTAALLVLDQLRPDAGQGVELLVLLGASAVAGLIRYLLLLIGVFPDSPVAFERRPASPGPRDLELEAA